MLSSVTTILARRTACRLSALPGSSAAPARLLSSTAPARERVKDPQSTPEAFKAWIDTSPEAARFKRAKRPNNWLGKTPFPQNPSFKPPVPVSNALKNAIYDQFMADPQANSVRVLAGKYHLGIKRIEAILRLKGLENHWIEGKSLKTGFMNGMQWHLGVEDEMREHKSHEEWVKARLSAVEADKLYDLQGDDMARSRYERMFFEPTLEGESPVMPGSIEKEGTQKDRRSLQRMDEKYNPAILGQHIDRDALVPTVVTKSGSAPGRPTMTFVDVGAQWVDVADRKKRTAGAARRAMLGAQRRLPGTHRRAGESNAQARARTRAAQEFKDKYRSAHTREVECTLRGKSVVNRFAARRQGAVQRAVAAAAAA